MALLFFYISSNSCGSSCNLSCASNCYSTCSAKNYGPTSDCSGWCLTNCTKGCLGDCCVGCCNSACDNVCVNVCMSSCGNGCGPMSNCGGDETIENALNCSGYCTSSSCSATGRNIFYYVVLNISLKLLGVIIWVEKEKFLKNQKV